MKHVFFVVLFLACALPLKARAEGEEGALKPEAEAVLPTAELGELAEVTTSEEPNHTTLLHLTLKNGQRYILPDDPLTPEQRETYARLTEAERVAFKERRSEYLKVLLNVLDKGRLPAGFISAAGKKVSGKFRVAFGKATGEPEIDKPTLSERGRRAIQTVIRLADSQLWDQAPMVAHSNEVGVTFEIGTGGGFAAGTRGWYGTTAFALAVNLDRKQKFVSLEFYQDIERLERAIPFTAGVAVYGAIMGNIIHNDWNKPTYIESGRSISGPGPILGTQTSESLRLGIGKAIGITPPGVSELAVITSKLTRIPWFRVGVSPMVPGYVRVKSGVVPAARMLASGLAAAPRATFSLLRGLCSTALSFFKAPPPGVDPRWYGN